MDVMKVCFLQRLAEKSLENLSSQEDHDGAEILTPKADLI